MKQKVVRYILLSWIMTIVLSGTVAQAADYTIKVGEKLTLSAQTTNAYDYDWVVPIGSDVVTQLGNRSSVNCEFKGAKVGSAKIICNVWVESYVLGFGAQKSMKYFTWFVDVIDNGEPATPEYKVSFSANGGHGMMDTATVTDGGTYTLPYNQFNAPVGYRFNAWDVGGRELSPKTIITVLEDVEIKALWSEIPNANSIVIASGNCGSERDEDIKWKIFADGRMVFEGTGAIEDYKRIGDRLEVYVSAYSKVPYQLYYTSAPWYNYRDRIKTVSFSDGITRVGSNLFYGEAYHYTNYKGTNYDVDHSFYNLESVTIPNTVESIGDVAFSWCTGLISIKIPDSVTNIGRSAFARCENLSEIKMRDEGVTLSPYAFRGTSLYDPIFQSDSTLIEEGLFSNCDNLTSFAIPDYILSIGNEAFSHCDNLVSVMIPENVTDIGDSAFDGCPNLVLTVIKDSYGLKYAQDNNVPYYETDSFDQATVQHIIYFEPSGGEVVTDRKTVIEGEPFGALPVPTRVGYSFDGWYTALTGGNKIIENSIVSFADNQIIYAHWTAIQNQSYITGLENRDGTINVDVFYPGYDAIIFCGIYNDDGKMISIESQSVREAGNYEFHFDTSEFDYAKVFLLDENLRPICESRQA